MGAKRFLFYFFVIFRQKVVGEMGKMRKIIWAMAVLLTLILITPAIAQPIEPPTEPPTEPKWVMMHGEVEYYGAEGAFGWCGVYAEVREWAQAFVAWMPWGEPQIGVIFNFYAARLVNTTLVELNYSGADLYIEGLWNVYNVTFIYEPGIEPGNFTLEIELLVDHGYGTLSVTGNWTDFTVDIRETELITGKVIFYVLEPIRIPIGDVSGHPQIGVPDGEVNIWDLVHAAKAYDSTPGSPWNPYYDFSFDFNFDYKIDIVDLTTIAVNIGESY